MSLPAFPEDWQHAVAVVAHPDDLEYGVASAVARWTDTGKRVSYVLVTSGEAGIDGIDPATCGPIREEEERRGAAIVGVDHVEFLGLPDGLVVDGVELRGSIAGAIRRLRPDIVVTMNFELTWGPGGPVNHADHRAVGLATIDATRDAANRWLFPDRGDRWDGVRSIWVAATSMATHFVDVTETLDRGIASLREHRVYIEGLGDASFDPDGFLRDSARNAGTSAGCEYQRRLSERPRDQRRSFSMSDPVAPKARSRARSRHGRLGKLVVLNGVSSAE
jgi:LmbE family N-acetylglucosaminyl deacetylase